MPTPNPTPPQGRQVDAELLGVSCPGRRACDAVGVGFGVDGSSRAIAERFDGASWQLESIPKTAGGLSPLTGVSCPSRFFCMAVGHIFGGLPFTGATLAARWTP